MVIVLSREQQEQYIRRGQILIFAPGSHKSRPLQKSSSDPSPRRPPMTRRVFHLQLAAIGIALMLAAIASGVGSAQAPRPVSIDGDDIGGVVTGPKGPEAGVWVVAETTD